MPASFSSEEQRILDSFTGRITPVPVSFGYGFALGLVALLMVLLPLIYLGIAGLVAWCWCWYATHGMDLIGGGHGVRSFKAVILVYGGPLVIGGVLVLFMFKPLFARAPKRIRPPSLDEQREPFLFAFVRRLCGAVGAPAPRRIDITCEVNASASFRNGAWSMLGSDLVLTIGLPLVAGQDLRQFAGVLAHEFGHFAQGWAMRANYVIRTVNHWFARVVYERDAWDMQLVAWANSDSHYAVNIILHLARFCVWLTRRVLWLLMVVGHLFSSLLSRQMEFDADRHAARLVGRAPFASALKELPVLGAAQQGAHQDLGQAWSERRLADDLPLLVHANMGKMSREVRERIIAQGLGESVGMYASHPATRDRVAAGEREPAQGVFLGADAPARVLFRDFPTLCRDTTLAWYREEAGLEVQPANLVPTGTLVAAYEREMAASRAAERIIGRLWSGVLLFAPAGGPAAAVDEEALIKDAEAAEEWVLETRRHRALAAAGIHDATDQQAGPTAALDRRAVVRARIGQAAAAIQPRLVAVAGAEAATLRACLATLASQQGALDEVREGFQMLVAVLNHLDGHQQDETYVNHVRWEMGQQRSRILRLRDACQGLSYPFEHLQQGIAVGEYLLAQVPAAEELDQIMGASEQMLRNAYALHRRSLARLAVLAESAPAP